MALRKNSGCRSVEPDRLQRHVMPSKGLHLQRRIRHPWLSLWSQCAPNFIETHKELNGPKMTQKWLRQIVDWYLGGLKLDSKVTWDPILKSCLSHFWVTPVPSGVGPASHFWIAFGSMLPGPRTVRSRCPPLKVKRRYEGQGETLNGVEDS